MNSHTLMDAAFLAKEYVGPRTVAATVFDGRLVSTVKMTNGLWYETILVDRNGRMVENWHYLNKRSALAGHWAICRIHLQGQ